MIPSSARRRVARTTCPSCPGRAATRGSGQPGATPYGAPRRLPERTPLERLLPSRLPWLGRSLALPQDPRPRDRARFCVVQDTALLCTRAFSAVRAPCVTDREDSACKQWHTEHGMETESGYPREGGCNTSFPLTRKHPLTIAAAALSLPMAHSWAAGYACARSSPQANDSPAKTAVITLLGSPSARIGGNRSPWPCGQD
jgi:hypothetical protein